MKSIFKNIWLTVILLSASQYAFTQVELKVSSATFPPISELPDTERARVLDATKNIINQYNEAMDLVAEGERKITPESVEAFTDLFGGTAEIDLDFEDIWRGQKMNPTAYANAVYNRFSESKYNTLRIGMQDARLMKIVNDPKGYWVAHILVKKLRETYVTSDNEVVLNPGGQEFYQMVLIDIPKGNLNNPKILEVYRSDEYGKRKVPALVDDYIQYFGPSLSVFSPSVSTTTSDLWNLNHSGSSFESSGQLGFSFGIDFMTNRILPKTATNKDLFLIGGIHFYNYRTKTSIQDFSIKNPGISWQATDGGSGVINYQRIVDQLSVDEELSFSVLSIPIGVGYRALKMQKSSLFVHAKLMPSFLMSASGSMTGVGTYDAYIPEADWRFYETKAADVSLVDQLDGYAVFALGEDIPIDKSGDPNKAGFLLGFQLSPVFYYDLSGDESAWSLMVGADINILPGSFIKHDDINDDLFQKVHSYTDENFSYDYTSIVERYADKQSFFAFAFKIGLQHRLITKP